MERPPIVIRYGTTIIAMLLLSVAIAGWQLLPAIFLNVPNSVQLKFGL